MNAQEIQDLAERLQIRPCLWNDIKRINARITDIRFIQSTKGPAVILYLTLRWDGLFGGSLERVSVVIFIEEGETLGLTTYQLHVEGPNLRDPTVVLWPCKDGMICYEAIKVRPVQEELDIGGIEVWHETNGQITIIPGGCRNGTRVEHQQKTGGPTTIDICLRDQHGNAQRFHLSPQAAESLGKALCFAAKK